MLIQNNDSKPALQPKLCKCGGAPILEYCTGQSAYAKVACRKCNNEVHKATISEAISVWNSNGFSLLNEAIGPVLAD
jgi:hypothetical protein